MPKIRVENLTKIFGSNPGRALELLHKGKSKDDIFKKTRQSVGIADVSFDVEEGEILVVMGLSGSGKSTLVRCINRLIEPTAGKVILDGQNLGDLSDKELCEVRLKKLGMVFQHFALFPHRDVLNNAAYGLEIQGVPAGIRKEKAMASLQRVGLEGWENAYPQQLSGGMQQRVGLARALALDPDILLMDEAFSALDPLIRRDMQDELIALQDEMQKTIVFISHDLDEALKLGDRIVLMKDGRVVQIGSPEDILTNPANEYVERFVEDVDISKVLTAESVMKKSEAVAHLKADGPHAALRKMKSNAISSLFVVDRERRLIGVVSAEDTAELVKQGSKDLTPIINRDITTVELDTPAIDLFELLKDIPYPLAVVDDRQRLKGVIIRGLLLAAIAERGGQA
ncbi:quaternary amine ABC transporter ATP-binding protein [Desulfoplanes formicivorans]|uniref:Glycine/betaine ABC transporter ATP-binding protein n=1 Tax=Desulfoplanes formicivorans TaxID=1592317 RepID=A0A194AD32_9BACT|nr:glycine betaine/L-proline ABC transporter ATP-binding protein [Desulfoplanes formicivorans]GAU08012.1 glycine/betaine ABC transporter ATP-binding protein [Desulfoplanes formicivorans]